MTAYRARYVFPVESPPMKDGVVRVADGRITAVEPAGPAENAVDLGNVALLPGLLNAHTHLEFSDLAKPIGRPGLPFPDWIRAVIGWRRERGETPRTAGLQRGLAECLRHGVTGVGEISVLPGWDRVFQDERLSGVVFHELLGLDDDAIEHLLQSARSFVDQAKSNALLPGISPHAPYTISLRCLQRVVEFAKKRRVPLAMHLAESPDELQLLNTKCGPLVELLSELNAWRPNAIGLGTRPLDFLRLLARAPRSLIIHGNYLDSTEEQLLVDQRDKMTLVYCPRTHTFFGHQPYPLGKRIRAGVHIALGTDSRASNPDLNLLAEIRHVVATHHDVPPETALKLGTLNAARALGLEHRLGSLRTGKRADLVAVALSRTEGDPYEALLADQPRVVRVFCGGQPVDVQH